ncbi:MAG TPA: MFS transporter [Candidatus Limnocylindria bacterium]|nr:MFS transporter [Candidatus Limnocylindria bacterium]
MRSRLGPFAQTAFTVYWAGGLVSNTGTWLQNVVASVFVYDRTGSALAVGLLNFASWAPMLLFSVHGGMISDRFDRRLIAIATQAVSLVVSAALAILAIGGNANEYHVAITAFLLQTSWTIAKPSVTAMLPALVEREQLTEAVGLNTLQFQIAQLAGPVLATVLLTTSGYAWAFAINAASFVAPILSMAYLYTRGLGGRLSAPSRRLAAGASTGIVDYVRSQPWIAGVMVGVISTSAVAEMIRTLSPVIVTHLGAPSSDTGAFVAAQSVGMVVGIFASVPFARRGLARAIAPVGFVFQSVGLVVVATAPQMLVAAVGGAFVGVGFSLCFPVLTGVLQTEVPDAVRGRLLALHQMAHLGNRPFAALAAGAIAAAFGPTSACLAGVILAPIGLVAVRSAWRGLDREAGPVPAIVESV